MSSLGSSAAARLETVTDEIISEARGLPSPLVKWVPAEGVWSVMDILCHIREFVPYWTRETVAIVRDPQQPWGRDHTDPARLAAVAHTAAYDLEDVLAGIRETVQASARSLGELSDADLATEAISRNPRWGRKPASFVVEHLILQHIEKHLGQIRRNVTQFRDARA